MPPTVLAEIILTALKIWLIILNDTPEAERKKAAERWYKFWDFAEPHLPKAPPVP